MIELISELIAKGHAYAAADGSDVVYFDVRSWPAYGELSGQNVDEMEAAKAFDIHGGGIDLRFPHHENERAQSRVAGRPFAAYGMHDAWITTAGEKMSKSLGNSLIVSGVLETFRGIELRYYLVAAHYRCRAGRRSPRWKALAASTSPSKLNSTCERVREGNRADDPATTSRPCARCSAYWASTRPTQPGRPAVKTTRSLIGAVDVLVRGMLEERPAARADKDSARADAIRDRLKAAGIEIEDTPTAPVLG